MFSLATASVSETIIRPVSDKNKSKHMVKFGSSNDQKRFWDDFESYQAAADHFVVHWPFFD